MNENEEVGRVPQAEPGSRPADQANLRCPDAPRVDPSRVLTGPLGEAVMREWQSFDVGEPEVAWAAAMERFRIEARQDQIIADRLRRDAADALAQADIHQARADDFRNLINAMERAPVTFPARDSDRNAERGDRETGRRPQDESAVPEGQSPNP